MNTILGLLLTQHVVFSYPICSCFSRHALNKNLTFSHYNIIMLTCTEPLFFFGGGGFGMILRDIRPKKLCNINNIKLTIYRYTVILS